MNLQLIKYNDPWTLNLKITYLVPSLSKHCNKSRDLTFYGPSIRLDSVYPACVYIYIYIHTHTVCQTNFLSHNIELTAIMETTILLNTRIAI